MPIPFGLGVGDFIAVGKLIKQIVVELQENGEAAPQYQGLLLELEALGRTLAQLENLQPAKHELIQLSAIRATAITYKRPLEEFLFKISKFESRLGIFNARDNRYKGFARRMQFSMMYKDEIKELRSILGSHVATINLLLMTQTVRSITVAENEREQIACGLASKILAHQRLLEDVKGHVEVSLGKHLETKMHLQDQSAVLESLGGKANNANEHLENQEAVLQAVQTTVTSTQVQTTSILATATNILALVTSGVVNLQLIMRQLSRSFELFTRVTKDMRESMSKLMLLFSSIYNSLQRIEALLPMRLNLPIVQFTDALGDTIALPHQLCQQWSTFKMMIGVIFSDKQGKYRVETGQYLIMNARGGRLLRETSWQHTIKQDNRLSISMILNELEAKDGVCPFPSCQTSLSGVQVKNGGQTCLECGRWVVLTPRKSTPSRPTNRSPGSWFDNISMSGWDTTPGRDSKEKLLEQKFGEDLEEDEEDIEVYRQVHVQTTAYLPIYSASPEDCPPNADRTRLQFAVENHDKGMIKFLLQNKFDVNAVFGIIQHTLLQIACRDGDREIAELLLESGAEVNAPPAKESGATALQFAAINGSLMIAALLLQHGADVNAPAALANGRTALEGAAEHGRIDMVQFLLNAGASITQDGQTQYENAVKRASKNGHYGSRELLESYHG